MTASAAYSAKLIVLGTGNNEERSVAISENTAKYLIDLQEKTLPDYPYVFIPQSRYDFIQTKLGAKGKWSYEDSRLNTINNFYKHWADILKGAGVRKKGKWGLGRLESAKRVPIKLSSVLSQLEYPFQVFHLLGDGRRRELLLQAVLDEPLSVLISNFLYVDMVGSALPIRMYGLRSAERPVSCALTDGRKTGYNHAIERQNRDASLCGFPDVWGILWRKANHFTRKSWLFASALRN